MRRYLSVVAALLASAVLVGCEAGTQGTTLSLGAVDYDEAFTAARSVMSQHFSVASADREAGLIESSPQRIDAQREGIFRTLAARQMAKMSLRRQGREVLANLTVEVQRQGSAVHEQLQMSSSGYDSVPHRTPAEIDAATTAEQNEAWQTEKYDHTLEYTVLRQLHDTLHASAPAKE